MSNEAFKADLRKAREQRVKELEAQQRRARAQQARKERSAVADWLKKHPR